LVSRSLLYTTALIQWGKKKELESELAQVQARLEEMSRENEQEKQKNLALLESVEEAREEV